MKILYISDLDGTLLNSKAELSQYTINTLNTLISQGIFFSIATARTAATTLQMMQNVPLEIPIILMNGVSIYDSKSKKYMTTEIIKKEALSTLLAIINDQSITGFLYSIDAGNLYAYYENLDHPQRKAFHDERVSKFGKVFTKVDRFLDCIDKKIVYFSVCDKFENLQSVYNQLKMTEGIHIEFYRDVYLKDFWYLEVCSDKASKYNAVNLLRENYGFDKIISFGDNLNDIPMFLASDECYAVENAKGEVKEKATKIINCNDHDGVAKWLEENYLKELHIERGTPYTHL